MHMHLMHMQMKNAYANKQMHMEIQKRICK